MARTAQLDLPLLMPSQAQKHVTVNEALARLDALAQLRVISSSVTTPPSSAVDGQSYLVPSGANGVWQGRPGQIALWSNGGWIFLPPKSGWRLWDEEQVGGMTFDGEGWIEDAVAISSGGAATVCTVLEFDHSLTPGATNSTSFQIPAKSQVSGVTGRVIEPITGFNISMWRIGVVGSSDRYGSGLGLSSGSYLIGLSGSPVSYYENTALLISAEGGTFLKGTIRLAIHTTQLKPPRSM